MIVYNMTVKVDVAVAPQWLQWLYQTQAPEMIATGCFWKYHVLHLLELDDAEGPTYAIQFYAHTTADYEKYRTHFAAFFNEQATKAWGDRFVSFSTLMQLLA
jgi:hypothetical protein